MRWSAVFAGGVLSLGLWILLQSIGMGFGLSAVDTSDPHSLRGVGIGTGVWSVIAPLLALFLGGMLAGRLAGTRDGRVGAMHGAVHWALTTVVGAYLVISLIVTVASGIGRAGGMMMGPWAHREGMMQTLGIDTNEVLTPVNQRLREQGKPEITEAQVDRSVRAVTQRGMGEGRIDRDMLAEELARNTRLTRADVDDLARQIEQRATPMIENAKTTALEAADQAGKGLLVAGIGLLLAMLASVGGGALGARMTARRDRDVSVTTTTIPPAPPPPTTTSTTVVQGEIG